MVATVIGLPLEQTAASEPVRLSLAKAQSLALEQNRALGAARAHVDEARGARLQTWAARLPSIQISEQIARTNDAVGAFGTRLRQERFRQKDFQLQSLNEPAAITGARTALSVSQPLLSLPDQVYGRRRADSGVRAAEAGLRRARDQVRLMTAEAYWGLVMTARSLEVVEHSLETAAAHAAVARAHFEEGTAPRTDMLAAEVRVSELRTERIKASNGVREAADHLTLAMGQAPVEVLPTDSLRASHPVAAMEELVAAALKRRPDLVAADEQVEMARQGLGAARSQYLPQVQAFAELALDGDAPFARQGESWTVGAMATWNLFTGLHTRGEVARSRARVSLSLADRDLARQRVEREVRGAYRHVESARSRLEVAEQAVAQAEERLRVSELKHQQGLMSSTDLLDAELAWRQTEIRRLQALHDLSVGVARLEFAVGGSTI
jgi:outer membrane protein TolC